MAGRERFRAAGSVCRPCFVEKFYKWLDTQFTDYTGLARLGLPSSQVGKRPLKIIGFLVIAFLVHSIHKVRMFFDNVSYYSISSFQTVKWGGTILNSSKRIRQVTFS